MTPPVAQMAPFCFPLPARPSLRRIGIPNGRDVLAVYFLWARQRYYSAPADADGDTDTDTDMGSSVRCMIGSMLGSTSTAAAAAAAASSVPEPHDVDAENEFDLLEGMSPRYAHMHMDEHTASFSDPKYNTATDFLNGIGAQFEGF